MTERELRLRRQVVLAFAETGRPPERVEDAQALRALADAHVVVLDERGAIAMAHPFAAPPGGAEVRAGARVRGRGGATAPGTAWGSSPPSGCVTRW